MKNPSEILLQFVEELQTSPAFLSQMQRQKNLQRTIRHPKGLLKFLQDSDEDEDVNDSIFGDYDDPVETEASKKEVSEMWDALYVTLSCCSLP